MRNFSFGGQALCALIRDQNKFVPRIRVQLPTPAIRMSLNLLTLVADGLFPGQLGPRNTSRESGIKTWTQNFYHFSKKLPMR